MSAWARGIPRSLAVALAWFYLVSYPLAIILIPIEFNAVLELIFEPLGLVLPFLLVWLVAGMPVAPRWLRRVGQGLTWFGRLARIGLLAPAWFVTTVIWPLDAGAHQLTCGLAAALLVGLVAWTRRPRAVWLVPLWIVPVVSSTFLILAFRIPEEPARCEALIAESPPEATWIWTPDRQPRWTRTLLPYGLAIDETRDLMLYTRKALTGGGDMTLLDLNTGEQLARMDFSSLKGIVQGVPERITLDLERGLAYVMTLAEPDHQVVVVRYGGRALELQAQVELPSEPSDVVLDVERQKLVVSMWPSPPRRHWRFDIWSMDLPSFEPNTRVDFGWLGLLEDMHLTKDGRLIATAPGGFLRIGDPDSLYLEEATPSGVGWVATVDSAGFLYSADIFRSEVHKLSNDGREILTTVDAPMGPRWLQADDRAGLLFVATYGAGAVLALDDDDLSTVVRWDTGRMLRGLAVRESTKTLYAAGSCGIVALDYSTHARKRPAAR